jgi:hypothetical protein
MNTGILWFYGEKKPLEESIKKAVKYYENKYGRTPNLCLVHPSALEGNVHLSLTMSIRPYRPVLPGHIWVGMEDE